MNHWFTVKNLKKCILVHTLEIIQIENKTNFRMYKILSPMFLGLLYINRTENRNKIRLKSKNA